MAYLLYIFTFALAALASPIQSLANRNISVTIENGTVFGGVNGNVEYFKGIPFAEPPLGPLRLMPPKRYNKNFGELDGTASMSVCMQGDGSYGSEDCLKLLVLRPANRSGEKLPVVVFIHGGAFAAGGAETGNDMTPLVKKGIDMGRPFIVVSIQYRLGAFGFLPGKELAGSANLGLRDQRLALLWVQGKPIPFLVSSILSSKCSMETTDNVGAFGGDPDKVVLFGFSAGAMSAMDHTIIDNGNSRSLFRGVMLGSGAIVPAQSIDSSKSQEIFNTLARFAGCSGSSPILECLRSINAETLQKAAGSLAKQFKYQGANSPFVPRPDISDSFFPISPELAISSGKFAKVPVLSGNTEDEGTLFALMQSNITTNEILVNYLATDYFPGNGAYVSNLVSKYTNDFGVSGSPYGTGLDANLFGQYKRLASILGDMTFIFERKFHLQKVCSEVPCWSYLNAALQGTKPLGSFHGSDGVQMLSGLSTTPILTQQHAAIAFINTLDPNGLGVISPAINWPKYTPSSPRLMLQKGFWNEVINDDFRSQQYVYWSENISKFRI